MFVPGSNLLGTLEGVVVARNVRHNRTFIRLESVDQICVSFSDKYQHCGTFSHPLHLNDNQVKIKGGF